ncbi:MAG: crossover junction endodeoxyribonuclease RuvC [Bacteroidales bacterium]
MAKKTNTTSKPISKIADDLTIDQLLSLDIATKTGYYSTHESGTWDFTESLRRNNNKQHKAFRTTLIEFINKHNIRQIVAEDVAVGKTFVAMRKLSEFRGILLEVCDEMCLPEPIFISPTSIKMFATGKGNADKSEVIDAVSKKWGVSKGADDNECDACALFYLIKRRYKL